MVYKEPESPEFVHLSAKGLYLARARLREKFFATMNSIPLFMDAIVCSIVELLRVAVAGAILGGALRESRNL